MVRYFVLLAVVAALVVSPLPVAAATSDCDRGGAIVGCPSVAGSVSGGAAVITGNETVPGQPERVPSAASGPSAPSTGVLFGSSDGRCIGFVIANPDICRAASGDPGIPTITIRDIATFIPTPGHQQMEPDGWTVAGLDTNFYAITGTHVVNGTLLGRPADVRFTPVSYRWAYGDGTSATKSTRGGTWAAQGIREFEPTPTSHVYEQLGDYTITLSIVFAAEYRFAGGAWRPVVGTITLPANDLHIRVGTAKTVLVEQDCLANPSGPGC